jgi:hypothetical protein
MKMQLKEITVKGVKYNIFPHEVGKWNDTQTEYHIVDSRTNDSIYIFQSNDIDKIVFINV